MTLSPADYAVLNAAIADLRAWDARDALTAKAGGRRNAMIARVAGDLERVANADEDGELPYVLRLFPYRETLDFYEYGVIQASVAGLEDARAARAIIAFRRPPALALSASRASQARRSATAAFRTA